MVFAALYIPPVVMIITFIVVFGKILLIFLSLIPPLLEVFLDVFMNPTKLVNDIITGIILGFTVLFESILGEISPAKLNSYRGKDKDKNKKIDTIKTNCYSGKFIRTVILIFCPPYAVFMAGGAKHFWQIIICAFLTVYCYYIPGLLYAILLTDVVKNTTKCIN